MSASQSTHRSRSTVKTSQFTQKHLFSRLHGAALGYFFIALVCIIWIAASFLVARLEARGVSPLMLSFICSSGFVTLLPLRIGVITRYLRERRERRAGASGTRRRTGSETDDAEGRGSGREGMAKRRVSETGTEAEMVALANEGVDAERGRTRDEEARAPYGFERHAEAALMVAPIWVISQVCFDYSLLMTTVTANSMLSSSSAVFTFMVSVWCGLDSFTWMKMSAVGAYVLGSLLVTFADDTQALQAAAVTPFDVATHEAHPVFLQMDLNSPAFGNFLALVSAALYAVYTATMKLYLREDDRTDMTLFFALMGVFNFIGYGSVLVLGRALGGFQNLFFALDYRAFFLACTKAFFDNVLSDYLWARAVLLTSPTIASIGLSLQIPLAAAIELLTGQPGWARNVFNGALMTGGMFCILVGFAGVTL